MGVYLYFSYISSLAMPNGGILQNRFRHRPGVLSMVSVKCGRKSFDDFFIHLKVIWSYLRLNIPLYSR